MPGSGAADGAESAGTTSEDQSIRQPETIGEFAWRRTAQHTWAFLKYRELRHLVQLRDTQVRQLTATKCRIKALLLYEGIPFPSDDGQEKQWSAGVLDELLELPCSETMRFKLDQLFGTLHFNFNAAAAA